MIFNVKLFIQKIYKFFLMSLKTLEILTYLLQIKIFQWRVEIFVNKIFSIKWFVYRVKGD